MKFRQWVGVVMVVACSVGLVFLLAHFRQAAPPAAETTPVSPIVTSSEPSASSSPTSSVPTPSQTAEPIDRVAKSEAVQLVIPGVLTAQFGGAILPNSQNALVPPTSTEVFRWADRGLPGCPADDTVFLLGHTVRAGGGVFDHLQSVQPGQEIVLKTKAGTIRYEVESTQLYDKETIADRDHVYAAVPGRLVLVGCFLNPDGSVQTKNFVVMARETSC